MKKTINHFHLFCGLGGGALGFNRGHARVGNLEAEFRCIGGVDVSPAAVRDFERLTGSSGTVLDLFSREQYRNFHGCDPPEGWREATPADIQAAAGNQHPHVVFLSAPCKGFSGLLSERKSRSAKYEALNSLTLCGIWLTLEAFADDPPELFVFENVPRIATRGRALLDQIVSVLRRFGYAVAETTHDCGELGGLAQSRKRFLLVARHEEKVPPFLFEPELRPLRAVGDVLGRMPLPGDPAGGPMHRVPRLQWKTWGRLAFVEAGSDWRSLRRLAVENGALRDYLIVPDSRNDHLGVVPWKDPSGAVSSRGLPTNGRYSVADPRIETEYRQHYMGISPWDRNTGTISGKSSPTNGRYAVADPRFQGKEYQQYGVRRWNDPSGAVSSQAAPGGGTYSVADPRCTGVRHNNVFRIVEWKRSSPSVTGGGGPSSGGLAVADPRPNDGPLFSKYPVTRWDQNTGTVIGGDDTGAYAVADPRGSGFPGKYKVTDFDAAAGTVISGSTTGNGAFAVADPRAARHDNGRWSVADPRMPKPREQLVAIIRALDGTWHRPFTTLELAALQGLVDPEEQLELDGLSDSAWRERIGNAVPPPSAQAIASVMGTTLLLAWSGQTFALGSTPIWVRPVAVGLSVNGGGR